VHLSPPAFRAFLTASAQVAFKASTQFSHAFLSATGTVAIKARNTVSAAFFNLTPVAARTIIAKRIHTLFAKW
jgi:hypothetical protein